MLTGPPRRRRARPVADAPVEALLERTEDLAKGWLMALLERAPLDDAPRILGADLSRDGPRVCAAMLRAIADDTDHRRLEPGGALAPLAARVGELAGASGPAAASLAVDALQGVIWSALRSELRDPDPDLISELAERLSQVTGLMRAAALEHESGTATVRASIVAVATGPAATSPGAPPGTTDPGTADSAPAGPPSAASAARSWPPRRAGPPLQSGSGWTPGSIPAPAAEPAPGPERPPAAEPWPPPAAGTAPEPGRELWVDALEDEIRAAAGGPLSLLLAELEDADRVRAVETEGAGASGTFGVFARAVREVARHQDILVCESDSRAWIIARDTGRTGAQALGTRIAAAVRAREPWRGAPLSASVGVAVLSEDGRSAAELIEAAEEARFAAAAEGVDVLRAMPSDGADRD